MPGPSGARLLAGRVRCPSDRAGAGSGRRISTRNTIMAYETQDSFQSRRDHGRTSGGTDIRSETSRGPGVAAVGGAVALVLAVAAIALLALGPSLTTERVADPAGAPAGGAWDDQRPRRIGEEPWPPMPMLRSISSQCAIICRMSGDMAAPWRICCRIWAQWAIMVWWSMPDVPA